MPEFFRPEQSRAENMEDVEKDLLEVMSKIKKTQVFEDDYLDAVRLVLFKKDEPFCIYEKEKAEKIETNADCYSISGFTSGLETSYAALTTREEYESFKLENLSDHQFVPVMFLDAKYSYEEFASHEMGHNVFDLAYNRKEGELSVFDLVDEAENIEGEITDLSDKYKDKIRSKLDEIFKKHGLDGVLDKFDLQRQKIAEIFAILMQREFSSRSGESANRNHGNLNIGKVREILSDVEGKISELNKKTGRKMSVEDFYLENHVLSLIAAPILESEYSDFNKRMDFFEL